MDVQGEAAVLLHDEKGCSHMHQTKLGRGLQLSAQRPRFFQISPNEVNSTTAN